MHRLHAAGLLGSVGRGPSSVDNAPVESFWSTMQRELLDRRDWSSRVELAASIFERIEGCSRRSPPRLHGFLHEFGSFPAVVTAA